MHAAWSSICSCKEWSCSGSHNEALLCHLVNWNVTKMRQNGIVLPFKRLSWQISWHVVDLTVEGYGLWNISRKKKTLSYTCRHLEVFESFPGRGPAGPQTSRRSGENRTVSKSCRPPARGHDLSGCLWRLGQGHFHWPWGRNPWRPEHKTYSKNIKIVKILKKNNIKACRINLIKLSSLTLFKSIVQLVKWIW